MVKIVEQFTFLNCTHDRVKPVTMVAIVQVLILVACVYYIYP